MVFKQKPSEAPFQGLLWKGDSAQDVLERILTNVSVKSRVEVSLQDTCAGLREKPPSTSQDPPSAEPWRSYGRRSSSSTSRAPGTRTCASWSYPEDRAKQAQSTRQRRDSGHLQRLRDRIPVEMVLGFIGQLGRVCRSGRGEGAGATAARVPYKMSLAGLLQDLLSGSLCRTSARYLWRIFPEPLRKIGKILVTSRALRALLVLRKTSSGMSGRTSARFPWVFAGSPRKISSRVSWPDLCA